jgi:ABC-2 type transport system ATP-binding protein
MTVPALDIRQLGYRYRAGFALEDIAVAVAPGRFTVLLGPNGAGKSTLVSLLTRLFTPSRGDIRIGGHSLLSAPGAALARLGVVFQQSALDLDLTVVENMRYGAALHGLSGVTAKVRIAAELDRMGLADRAREPVRRLSGGFRRRLELARALLHRPALLVCDEATVGLDAPSRRALVAHLRDLCVEDGLAVLWTTHLFDEVAAGDEVVLLQAGRVASTFVADDQVEARFAALVQS